MRTSGMPQSAHACFYQGRLLVIAHAVRGLTTDSPLRCWLAADESPEAAALRELVEELWEPCLSQHSIVVSTVGEALSNGSCTLLAGAPDRAGLEPLFGPFADTRVLGRGDDARAVTGTIVSPVVAAVARPLDDPVSSSLRPSDEVEVPFALSLRQILDPSLAHLQRITYVDPAVIAARHARALDKGHQTKSPHVPPAADRTMSMDVPVFTGGPAPVWGLTALLLDRLLERAVLPALQRSGHGVDRPPLRLQSEGAAHD